MTLQFNCRRCSECIGEDHHWMESPYLMEDGDPWFVCKHCDAACGSVDDENGISMPDGVAVRNSPVCDGCDLLRS